MCGKSWTLILASALLSTSFFSPASAATVCNASFYGNPNPLDCSRILLDNRAEKSRGLESKDRKPHLFDGGDLDWDQQPLDVKIMEWRNKVDLPITISRGKWELVDFLRVH